LRAVFVDTMCSKTSGPPVLERSYKPPESWLMPMIHLLWQCQRKEILLDMFLERYQESAGTFWRETTQLHAKILTSANILTFEEKHWKFHASSYLATGKPRHVDKLSFQKL